MAPTAMRYPLATRRPRLPWQIPLRRPRIETLLEIFERLDVEQRRDADAAPELRANFPLPPELREIVYSYLLCVEQDGLFEDGEEHLGSPWYNMAPELFTVNKVIRSESLGYLLRKHQFLVLDYEMEGLREMLDAYRVPIVKHHSPDHFKHYALHLGVHAESRSLSGEVEPNQSRWRGSDLMLVKDLPLLIDVLRLVGHQTRAKFVYIDTERGMPVKPKVQKVMYGGVHKVVLELKKGKSECAQLNDGDVDKGYEDARDGHRWQYPNVLVWIQNL